MIHTECKICNKKLSAGEELFMVSKALVARTCITEDLTGIRFGICIHCGNQIFAGIIGGKNENHE